MQGTALLAARNYDHVVRKSLLAVASTSHTPFIRTVHNAPNRLGSWRNRVNKSKQPCIPLHEIKSHSLKNPITVFESTSNNVYHNLAIENFLLRNSDPNSRILFFYTNEPCVVIGRNQNPWTECNLEQIQQKGIPWNSRHWAKTSPGRRYETGTMVPLDLVRRRSGGGTVIHDTGNLNFSVIVPNDKDFTRARHAEMVVEALRSYSIYDYLRRYRLYESVRVNERNDIVMTRPPGPLEQTGTRREWKISGSAYKLIRGRAMHHGTLLHTSPNVRYSLDVHSSRSIFSRILTAEGRPYIEAKGVESVPSAVGNLFKADAKEIRNGIRSRIIKAITNAFYNVYSPDTEPDARLTQLVTDADCLQHINSTIAADANELNTDAWRFEQTPQFIFSSLSPSALSFHVNKGVIEHVRMRHQNLEEMLRQAIEGKKLHEISGQWSDLLADIADLTNLEMEIKRLKFSFPRVTPAQKVVRPWTRHLGLEQKVVQQSGARLVRETASGKGKEVEQKGQSLVEETT